MSLSTFKIPEDFQTGFWTVWRGEVTQVKMVTITNLSGDISHHAVTYMVESVDTGKVFAVDDEYIWRSAKNAKAQVTGRAQETIDKAIQAEEAKGQSESP